MKESEREQLILDWLASAPKVPKRDFSKINDGGGIAYKVGPLVAAIKRLEDWSKYDKKCLDAIPAIKVIIRYIDKNAGSPC